MSFRDKVVIVTGGSSGIGAATAVQFAAEKATVAIVGRKTDKLAEVSEMCEKKGSKPLVIVADLTKDEDIRRVINETLHWFGKIDVLVNNAGIYRSACILDHDAMTNFDNVMRINFRSIVYLTNLAAPYLVDTKGNIVNVGSVAGSSIVRSLGTFPYCSSKAALDHFTRCVASELAPKGVRVNAVNPGPVRTDIIKNMGIRKEHVIDKTWKKMAEATALQRISDPDEIADLIVYLASNKARGITGSSIVSDNGCKLKEVKEY